MIESSRLTPPSSSGPGRGPLKAKTRIRIPLGAQKYLSLSSHRGIIKAKTRIRIPPPNGCAARGGTKIFVPLIPSRDTQGQNEDSNSSAQRCAWGYKYSWYLASSIQCLVYKLVRAAHVLTLRSVCFATSKSGTDFRGYE